MTKKIHLDQSVFQKRDSEIKIERDAAQLLISAASGNRVDPALIWKASKILEKAGIPVDRQWGRQNIILNADGKPLSFGVKKLFISELDNIKRPNMGERGGNVETAFDRVFNEMNCYNK